MACQDDALYDSFANFSHSRRKGAVCQWQTNSTDRAGRRDSALPRHERQKRGWGESSHKKCCLGEPILETQLSHPGSLRGKNGSASMLLSRGLPAGAARRGRKGCALMMLPRGLEPERQRRPLCGQYFLNWKRKGWQPGAPIMAWPTGRLVMSSSSTTKPSRICSETPRFWTADR